MQKKYPKGDLNKMPSLEAAFLKNIIRIYVPKDKESRLSLLPPNQAASVLGAKDINFTKYPDLISEIRCWNSEQQMAIVKSFPDFAKEIWKNWLEKDSVPNSPLSGMILQSVTRSGANRICFVKDHPFKNFLKFKGRELSMLCDLVAFRFIFSSISLLIKKEHHVNFQKYLEEYTHQDLLKSYYAKCQEDPLKLSFGTQFAWSCWNGNKTTLSRIVQSFGLTILAITTGHNDLLFLLKKRMSRQRMQLIERAQQGKLVSKTILNEIREITMEAFSFLENFIFSPKDH